MRRPLWLLALLLALVVAAVFAWLGQWQMSHAIRVDAEQTVDSETPRPLDDVSEPGEPVDDDAAGMVVTAEGAFVPGDIRVVEERMNQDRNGAWVVGHFITEAGGESKGHLAVAIGWAPDAETAADVAEAIDGDPAFADRRVLEGRYMPSEGPVVPAPDESPYTLRAMAPAQLVNLWNSVDGPAYSGFLVEHPGEAGAQPTLGLDPIDSVPPLPVEKINWLNVFYAIEWVVFAGFAVFFWYRLARDAWEKEHELKLLEQAEE